MAVAKEPVVGEQRLLQAGRIDPHRAHPLLGVAAVGGEGLVEDCPGPPVGAVDDLDRGLRGRDVEVRQALGVRRRAEERNLRRVPSKVQLQPPAKTISANPARHNMRMRYSSDRPRTPTDGRIQ